ncbi:MAG TPA: hypothetical protein DCM59_09605 [Clostridium sp.]|nr:hypothetical protein [Clostridium sp.]
MSYENKQTYMGENKTILALAGDLFQNVNVKVLKSNVPEANGKRILKAGTFISKDGKIVDGTIVTDGKAFGLIYRDVNFTHSNGNETVPVLIFGFINSKTLPKQPSETVKTALKMVTFL